MLDTSISPNDRANGYCFHTNIQERQISQGHGDLSAAFIKVCSFLYLPRVPIDLFEIRFAVGCGSCFRLADHFPASRLISVRYNAGKYKIKRNDSGSFSDSICIMTRPFYIYTARNECICKNP